MNAETDSNSSNTSLSSDENAIFISEDDITDNVTNLTPYDSATILSDDSESLTMTNTYIGCKHLHTKCKKYCSYAYKYEYTDIISYCERLLHKTFIPTPIEFHLYKNGYFSMENLRRLDLLRIYDIMCYPGQELVLFCLEKNMKDWAKKLIKSQCYYFLVSCPYLYDHQDAKNSSYNMNGDFQCKPFYGTLVQMDGFSILNDKQLTNSSPYRLLTRALCRVLIVDYDNDNAYNILDSATSLSTLDYISNVGFYTAPFNYNDPPSSFQDFHHPINISFSKINSICLKNIFPKHISSSLSPYISLHTLSGKVYSPKEILELSWSYLPVKNESRLKSFTSEYLHEMLHNLVMSINSTAYCYYCRQPIGSVKPIIFFNRYFELDWTSCTASYFTNPSGIPFEVYYLDTDSEYFCLPGPKVDYTNSFLKDHGWSYLTCETCGSFIGWAFVDKIDSPAHSDNHSSAGSNMVFVVIKEYCSFVS